MLARVLGEIASPSLGLELVQFADDRVDELRAASARALSHSQSSLAIDVLSELAHDRTWFVRLRAMVSLGRMSDSRAIPPLLHGLVDSNRLVRLRAAESLVAATGVSVSVFKRVAAAHDRYGLHAYLAALENADLAQKLREKLECDLQLSADEKSRLRAELDCGYLTEQRLHSMVQETAVLA